MVIGKTAGYLSLILLLAVWTSLFLPVRLWPPAREGDVYAIATLMACLSGIAGVIAGWKYSKAGYISATLGFATCALFLAGAAV